MSDKERVAGLDEIKANLLEVRSHPEFNMGSPRAIDHLLLSLVAIIDALQERYWSVGDGGQRDD